MGCGRERRNTNGCVSGYQNFTIPSMATLLEVDDLGSSNEDVDLQIAIADERETDSLSFEPSCFTLPRLDLRRLAAVGPISFYLSPRHCPRERSRCQHSRPRH